MITSVLMWGMESMHSDLLSNLPERVCSFTPTPPRWGDLMRNRAWLQTLIKASSGKQASSWLLIFLPQFLLLCLPSASTGPPPLFSVYPPSFFPFSVFYFASSLLLSSALLSMTVMQVRCYQHAERLCNHTVY